MTGNRELSLGGSCGNPANATNRERFSTAEWPDVNAMYRILGDSTPSLEGSRDTVWPLLCCAMHVWLKENEVQRALIIDTDRPPWVNHEAFYGCWMVARCLRLRWARENVSTFITYAMRSIPGSRGGPAAITSYDAPTELPPQLSRAQQGPLCGMGCRPLQVRANKVGSPT